MIAAASGGQTALPRARMPAREPFGNNHWDGNPCKTAVSLTVRHRTVRPLASHQVKGWDAVTVCAGPLYATNARPTFTIPCSISDELCRQFESCSIKCLFH